MTVVTGPPLHPRRRRRRASAGRSAREDRNGVEIVACAGTRFDKRRFAGRAANYLTYLLSACWAGLRLDRPDVVVALTDPPIIGLAALAGGAGGSARRS